MASDLPQHRSAQSGPRREGNAVPASPGHHSRTHVNVFFASPQPLGLNRKQPRSSKIKTDKIVTNSISTPHLRHITMSESDADKKRNKLGYQRISIACAHCRRRKIRCVVAEDDPEQRCQNCIRLKKECVFYPVDQQAVLDARSDNSSNTGIPSAPSSAAWASPLQSGGPRGFEQHAFSANYPPTAPPPPPVVSTTYQGVPLVPSTSLPTHVSRTPSAQSSVARYHPMPAPDVAPFPGPEPFDHVPSNAPQVPYGGFDPEHARQAPQAWQHQPQAPRPMQYSSYQPNYSPYQQQVPLQSDYPRQSPMPSSTHPMMQMPSAVHSHGPQQYMVHHGQRSASAPGTPQIPYPGPQQAAWYPGAPPQSPAHDHPRKLPSNYPPPGGYHPGPG
ncbi:hypothetical protein CERZMDRAFT_84822 [Cercospora zeae-maydis SCOH1-5]|uniref:Zn(2)-C6 fungal-type domain-containing protein n=1 Tax=Cercospora zeae-maydis SCOH1-5 TaxID=717836 RepID=A0A6A6FGE6_9PEZI|nr:hypothetical protein CERZMDRAFT_84822 [Cercospora zeae-maydis SCOH1-5]